MYIYTLIKAQTLELAKKITPFSEEEEYILEDDPATADYVKALRMRPLIIRHDEISSPDEKKNVLEIAVRQIDTQIKSLKEARKISGDMIISDEEYRASMRLLKRIRRQLRYNLKWVNEQLLMEWQQQKKDCRRAS